MVLLALITLCQKLGWSYRIRLKGNLRLTHEDGWELNATEAKNMGLRELAHVKLGEKGPELNVGILHEPGHPKAWFIAMDLLCCAQHKMSIATNRQKLL